MQVSGSTPTVTLGGGNGSITAGILSGAGALGGEGALGVFDLLLGMALGGEAQGESQGEALFTTGAAPTEKPTNKPQDATNDAINVSSETAQGEAPVELGDELEAEAEELKISDDTKLETDDVQLAAGEAAAIATAGIKAAPVAPVTTQAAETAPAASTPGKPARAKATSTATSSATPSTQPEPSQPAWNIKDLSLGLDQAIDQLEPQGEAAQMANEAQQGLHVEQAASAQLATDTTGEVASNVVAQVEVEAQSETQVETQVASETQTESPIEGLPSDAPETEEQPTRTQSAQTGHGGGAEQAKATGTDPGKFKDGTAPEQAGVPAPKQAANAKPEVAHNAQQAPAEAAPVAREAARAINGLEQIFQSGQITRGEWDARSMTAANGHTEHADGPAFSEQMREATRFLATQTEGVIRMGDKGVEAQLKLNPPELGGVQVNLKVGSDLSVRAEFIAERGETVQLIQNNIEHFRTVMGQHGLVVDRVQVSISAAGASNSSSNAENGADPQYSQQDSRYEGRSSERRGNDQSRGNQQRAEREEQE